MAILGWLYRTGLFFNIKGLLFGLVFGGLGGWFMVEAAVFRLGSTAQDLTVVDLKVLQGDDGPSYIPTYQLIVDGREVRYTGNSAIGSKPHDIGDVVHGYYNANTQEMRSLKEMLIWSAGGLAFFLAGVFFARPSREQKDRAREIKGLWGATSKGPELAEWNDGIDRENR